VESVAFAQVGALRVQAEPVWLARVWSVWAQAAAQRVAALFLNAGREALLQRALAVWLAILRVVYRRVRAPRRWRAAHPVRIIPAPEATGNS